MLPSDHVTIIPMFVKTCFLFCFLSFITVARLATPACRTALVGSEFPFYFIQAWVTPEVPKLWVPEGPGLFTGAPRSFIINWSKTFSLTRQKIKWEAKNVFIIYFYFLLTIRHIVHKPKKFNFDFGIFIEK